MERYFIKSRKAFNNLILEKFRIMFTANARNEYVTMFSFTV